MIVFAGVHFMAETAKILNPTKKVVIPDLKAGCSLSEGCPPELFQKFREQHPDHVVISYINCSAGVKALTDVICTSSNAKVIVDSFPKDQKIIFAPDRNLGGWINRTTGRDMLAVERRLHGARDLFAGKNHPAEGASPGGKSDRPPRVRGAGAPDLRFYGLYDAITGLCENSGHNSFIVATEAGILHQMAKQAPGQDPYPRPAG
jgi:quinolinate synthase